MPVNNSSREHGQSTIEYLLLLAVVLSVLIAFVNLNGGFFSVSLNKTMQVGINTMVDVSNAIVTNL